MTRSILSIPFILVFFANQVFSQKQQKVLVAAASDLRYAMDSIIQVYPDAQEIEVIYGSSGKFYEQISNGAPFDLYFSADLVYPKKLQENGKTASEIFPYGIGRLVLWSKKDFGEKLSMEILKETQIRKVAIANPRHAPYGQRAEEALKHFNLFEQVKPNLVFGENIAQTAQFVGSGAADIGIIALSLALSPNMKKMNPDYYLIPESSHQPLMQGAVLIKHSELKPGAVKFLDFAKGEQVQMILVHFGFTKP
ncbi:molybdate transport system substrate-binding protein [Aquiflexum balticum DSM 16537]|uniref:Molybdate transport system substrate-binding protein n=1 Tax=Aquiflexum balticum DSM 16537 TaxID=758820 RepID=A0A1W2GZW0_9BACT|nr:molybdate ABC transporter substrate-binding protein [Aquiflexum balticum]SMD42227.1 molybdate transport system substrate-binding protein [Aquiflexum balticum DSM 16537]